LCCGYFWDRIPHLCQGQPEPRSSYASLVTRMAGAPHHTHHFIGWDEGLSNFLPGLASNYDPSNLNLPSS
jgi:hypothetical protein